MSAGKNRHIIARLHIQVFKNSILEKARRFQIGEGEEMKAVNIFADLTKEDFILKKRALPVMRNAHEAGHKFLFQRGQLFINGQRVKIPEAKVALQLVPPENTTETQPDIQ